MYHNIDDEAAFNTVSIGEFINQLNYLRDNYNIVSLENYVTKINQRIQTDDDVVITFDDGYVNFAEKALPIIEQFSVPVIQFIPVDYIGKHNEWDANHPQSISLSIMDNNLLKSLSNHQLITFGSHGMSHKSVSTLSEESIVFELSESKRILTDITGYKIDWFSYPYGQIYDYNSEIISIVEKTGYMGACSTRFGRKNSIASLYKLYRVEVHPSDKLRDFINKCHRNFYPKQIIKEIMYNLHLHNPSKQH